MRLKGLGWLADGLTHAVFVSLIALTFLQPREPESTPGGLAPSAPAQAAGAPAARITARPAAPSDLPSPPAGAVPPLPEAAPEADATGSRRWIRLAAERHQRAKAVDASQEVSSEPLPPEKQVLMDRLVAAYPDFLSGHDGRNILWRDGQAMPFDDGRVKTARERLETPDLEDQFADPYETGPLKTPATGFDPGRVRYEPFFLKMYGDCRKGEVERKLVDVVWLPKRWGRTVKVTPINGVAERLRQVSAELDELPESFLPYLRPPAGTYNCRAIAGTNRLSMHAYGASIDLNASYGDYWRWAGKEGGRLVHTNRVPLEIVEVFERHGFIWGGRWYHYDTFHFEYRPELLPSSQTVPVAGVKSAETGPRPAGGVAPLSESGSPEEAESPGGGAPAAAPMPARQPRVIPR
jgi:hypothetical protein